MEPPAWTHRVHLATNLQKQYFLKDLVVARVHHNLPPRPSPSPSASVRWALEGGASAPSSAEGDSAQPKTELSSRCPAGRGWERANKTIKQPDVSVCVVPFFETRCPFQGSSKGRPKGNQVLLWFLRGSVPQTKDNPKWGPNKARSKQKGGEQLLTPDYYIWQIDRVIPLLDGRPANQPGAETYPGRASSTSSCGVANLRGFLGVVSAYRRMKFVSRAPWS